MAVWGPLSARSSPPPNSLLWSSNSNRGLSEEIESHGFFCVTGDATEEKVLNEAGIARARVLIGAMPNDAENVFITLTGRQICPNLLIIARAEQPSTVKKLKHAGANHVVMPAAMGRTGSSPW